MKKIRFYQHRENLEVYAVIEFQKNGMYLTYSQVGQHSDAHPDYIKESRRLNRNNTLVEPLYKELSQIYND